MLIFIDLCWCISSLCWFVLFLYWFILISLDLCKMYKVCCTDLCWSMLLYNIRIDLCAFYVDLCRFNLRSLNLLKNYDYVDLIISDQINWIFLYLCLSGPTRTDETVYICIYLHHVSGWAQKTSIEKYWINWIEHTYNPPKLINTIGINYSQLRCMSFLITCTQIRLPLVDC